MQGSEKRPRALRGKAECRAAWVLLPGRLSRPWGSSALARPGKACVKSGFHTVKGHGGLGSKERKPIRSLEKSGVGRPGIGL